MMARPMGDRAKITERLLATSLEHVQGKYAYAEAIRAARAAGWPDDEIAHVTGDTWRTIEQIAGRRPSA
jgi:hypothetical protein